MPITLDQKTAMDQVLAAILAATAPRGKRQLSAMFMQLVDREEWPQYYEVRLSLNNHC
jgi:chromatin structure-remodeling complex subunit RSC1/2